MKKHDFLITGGGIFGITAALELNKRKYSVGLLNPDTIPHPLASSTDISKVVRMEYGSDLLYMDMAAECIEGWHGWNELFNDTLYHEVGFLLVCKRPLEDALQTFEKASYDNLLLKGYKPQRLDAEAINECYPGFGAGRYMDGFYNPKAGYAESGRVVDTLARYARQLGVSIYEGQTAEFFEKEKNTVTAARTREGGRFEAGHFVICAGPHSPYLLPDLKPFMRVTGHPVFHIKPSRPELFAAPQLPVFAADISNSGWYGFPLHPREHVVKVGNHGAGQELHPDKDERVVTRADIQHFRSFLKVAFPAMANDPIVYTRRCLYTDTLDGHFWIDRHPAFDNLSIGTGGSGHGLKMAPVLGSLIATAAEGGNQKWSERFRWRDLKEGTAGQEEARFKKA